VQQRISADVAIITVHLCTCFSSTAQLLIVLARATLQQQMRLLMLFPQFTHLFNELKGADAPFAKQCLEHYSRSLAGPPNRPTRDKTGTF
jgi:hypothetical protein